MRAKELAKQLLELVEKHGDFLVVYQRDPEGNGFHNSMSFDVMRYSFDRREEVEMDSPGRMVFVGYPTYEEVV